MVISHAYYEAWHVPLVEMGLAQWEGTFRTNVTSSFLVVRAYRRGLLHAHGSARESAVVVLIGGTADKFGEHGHTDNAATKSGVRDVYCDIRGSLAHYNEEKQ